MKISERRCAGNHYIILGMQRCAWADKTPLMRDYHDLEWGTPVHEDSKLFEFLILEGAQAGLSWETILKKRENYRAAFHAFGRLEYRQGHGRTRMYGNYVLAFQ